MAKPIKKTKQIQKNKKKGIVFIIVAAAVVVAAGLIIMISGLKSQTSGSLPASSLALTVNSEPVSVDEYKLRMVQDEPNIFLYFHDKYGVQQKAGFWTTPLGGETPLDKLKAQALSDVVRIKVEQILGKQKGIVKDISYSTFLKNLDAENKRRQDAIQNHQVLYGNSSVTATDYFNVLHNDMVQKVKDQLAGKEFALTPNQIQKLYDENKDKLYKQPDTINTKEFSVSNVDKTGNVQDIDSSSEAKTVSDKIKSLVDKGIKPEDIEKELGTDPSVKVSMQDQVFDSENSDKGDDTYYLLVQPATGLAVGKASEVIKGYDAYFVLFCTGRSTNGYLPFDEVKQTVVAKYVDQKYNEMIDQLVQKAKVVINNSVYDGITPN